MSTVFINNMLLAATLGSVVTKIAYIGLAFLILLFMITIHELGHYTAGKLLKFKINEFAVGFGKAIFSRKNKSGEKISLRMIPLGGYCAFEGEDETGEGNPQSFNNQAAWKRLIVLFSGVLFNFISAIIFSVFLLAMMGNGTPKITSVTGPNASIVQQNDIILKVNGTTPGYLNGGFAGLTANIDVDTPVVLTIKRDGEILTVTVEKYQTAYQDPITDETKFQPMFNISSQLHKLSFGESLLNAVPFTFDIAVECIQILGKLVTGQISINEIGGPVTTINVIADASSANIISILLLLPLISVNLAVFNLLPIPALDGARMVFILIEIIRRKPINRELEGKIHTIGLLLLFSLVIIVDLLHLIG